VDEINRVEEVQRLEQLLGHLSDAPERQRFVLIILDDIEERFAESFKN
jgi:hypothetical protein